MKKLFTLIFLCICSSIYSQNSEFLFQNPCEKSVGNIVVKEGKTTIMIKDLKPKTKFTLDVKTSQIYTIYFQPFDRFCKNNPQVGESKEKSQEFELEIGGSNCDTCIRKGEWTQYYSQKNVLLINTLNCPVEPRV